MAFYLIALGMFLIAVPILRAHQMILVSCAAITALIIGTAFAERCSDCVHICHNQIKYFECAYMYTIVAAFAFSFVLFSIFNLLIASGTQQRMMQAVRNLDWSFLHEWLAYVLSTSVLILGILYTLWIDIDRIYTMDLLTEPVLCKQVSARIRHEMCMHVLNKPCDSCPINNGQRLNYSMVVGLAIGARVILIIWIGLLKVYITSTQVYIAYKLFRMKPPTERRHKCTQSTKQAIMENTYNGTTVTSRLVHVLEQNEQLNKTLY